MSFSYSTNLTPANGAEMWFNIKARLKSVGWTVPRSSDGSTYNSSGDQITTASSGGGGMANVGAWFVLQMPATGRQWCLQISTTGGDLYKVRMKYSFAA